MKKTLKFQIKTIVKSIVVNHFDRNIGKQYFLTDSI